MVLGWSSGRLDRREARRARAQRIDDAAHIVERREGLVVGSIRALRRVGLGSGSGLGLGPGLGLVMVMVMVGVGVRVRARARARARARVRVRVRVRVGSGLACGG